MENSESLYRKRLWLNPLHGMGDAYISASLDRDEWEYEDTGRRKVDIHGSVGITDCTRKINLSFGANRKSVKKLNKMIRILTEFREALEGTVNA